MRIHMGLEVLGHPEVSDFLEYFKVDADPLEDLDKFLESLQQLDPRYQGGRKLVRWQLEADTATWPADVKSIVGRTASTMHMLAIKTPLVGDFDLAAVMGGARQSNLDRAMYAAKAIDAGQATAKHIVVAGSSRVLLDTEKEGVSNYAPGAQMEYDLCQAAASRANEDYPALHLDSLMVCLERAGNDDILRSILIHYSSSKMGCLASVAAITTQIYEMALYLDLRRVAKEFGITRTFVAGTPSDPAIVRARTTATYLSEVLRTLRAAALAAHAGV